MKISEAKWKNENFGDQCSNFIDNLVHRGSTSRSSSPDPNLFPISNSGVYRLDRCRHNDFFDF